MKTLKLSVHSTEHIWLRQLFIAKRKELDLSQRALAERLGVVYSFVGKVETGDRRLDVFEFMNYCHALKLDPIEVLNEIKIKFYNDLTLNN
ncbi:helix-turn-helix transcriptional regulator [Acinetobacter baumannii]|uniref:helix-turn-helix domain-containing protein n=1 Tax=Acinetobacter calcoaceticus/baumannii complex TaxID=909768 RepID=UPI00101EBC86|nr:helix-turn-helix transcriptional regulator [Acinetobacter baumannii]MCC8263154.1 helix-turn-helix domain-containing protein [Acinetobacter baumannii]MCC8271593.1 helix-turn-helix domain-containing protein [Acinetobacter baumannii]MCC8297222.1 helix-turn-helix domain-containing protein [Acinetobacter baumannii]MCC8320972.1 helix-turn-helix domain-containing protein [Acinetobacter baumannii]MCC8325580.1 helix-turn-helix domain-containing protein [Acinetobacter baumannii]